MENSLDHSKAAIIAKSKQHQKHRLSFNKIKINALYVKHWMVNILSFIHLSIKYLCGVERNLLLEISFDQNISSVWKNEKLLDHYK